MTTDIFIKTYHKDFIWLEWCLKSIKKFASGFRDIVVVSETGHDLPDHIKNIIPIKVFYVDFPEQMPTDVEHGLGYLWQQNIKLTWYDYTDANEVLVLDSDEMLTQPTTPGSFKTDDKPNWYYSSWDKMGSGACWKASTDFILKTNTEYSGMCITGFILKRSTTISLKNHLCTLHDVASIWDIFVKYNMPTASEYNIIGCYIWLFSNEYNKVAGYDASKVFNNTIKKEWSWGGLNSEKIKECEEVLSLSCE